jgi:hypothetical protein
MLKSKSSIVAEPSTVTDERGRFEDEDGFGPGLGLLPVGLPPQAIKVTRPRKTPREHRIENRRNIVYLHG